MKSFSFRALRLNLAALAVVLLAVPLVSARQNPLSDLMRGVNPQLAGDERKALEEKVAGAPDNPSAWRELADYSYRYDQPEETVAVIRRGLTKLPKDEPLWRLLAQVYLMDARSGPDWVQRPGVTHSRKPKPVLGEQEFREKSFIDALDALDHVAEISPGNLEVAERRVHVFFGLERWKEAEAAASAILQNRPTGEMAAMRGYALLKLERKDDAHAYIENAIARDRSCADLHFVRARILEASGNEAAGAEEVAMGEFYGRLVPGGSVVYTPELAASLKRMFGKKEGTSGMFSGDRLNDQIGAEIDTLAAHDDDASSELLASLALSHFAHGPLEDRAFTILGDRKQIPLLIRIYNHAQSPCTLGGCLRQLVRLRVEGTYEKLCDLLPKDGGMFPIGVIGLMVELNDPRSAQPLVAYTESKDAPFFEEGLVALGCFDSPETRSRLEKWISDKDAKPYAATALYRLTKDNKWVKPIKDIVRKGELYDLWPIANALKRIDTPDAKKILEVYSAREKEAAAKREKEKKK
jgi:tetratricopeptide (TPR) repeat protein